MQRWSLCFLSLFFGCSGPSDESGGADTALVWPVWQGTGLALQDCGGTERRVAELRARRGLVVAIGAEWCEPCQEDAPLLQEFADTNADIGVVQILVEDAAAQPITRLACDRWTEAFSLSYPVLVDPLFLTTDWVASGFPVHLALSVEGEERLRDDGPFDVRRVAEALAD